MRPIKQCINKQLADLCQRSIQLEELSHKITQFLPPELANECQVGGFVKGCLILTTTNSAWASQLRYAIPELRDKLRIEAKMYQLSSIKITVREPIKPVAAPKSSIQYQISEKAKIDIINESQHCTYQPLKRALLHLAKVE